MPSMSLSVKHRMEKAAIRAGKVARPDCLPGMAHRWACGDQVNGRIPATCSYCKTATTFVAPEVMVTDFNNHSAPGQAERILLARRPVLEEWEVE